MKLINLESGNIHTPKPTSILGNNYIKEIKDDGLTINLSDQTLIEVY